MRKTQLIAGLAAALMIGAMFPEAAQAKVVGNGRTWEASQAAGAGTHGPSGQNASPETAGTEAAPHETGMITGSPSGEMKETKGEVRPVESAAAETAAAGTAAAETVPAAAETAAAGTAAAETVPAAAETAAAETVPAAVENTGAAGGADAASGTVIAAVPPAGAVESAAQEAASQGNAGGYDLKDPRVVTTTLFGGGELMMLAPDSASQMMSFLITTKSGKLIAVDGGTATETEHLKAAIKKKGGVVSAWLVTHPHSDHVGAMTEILKEGAASGVTVENVYYNFAPIEWYFANEEYRAQMVADCMEALSALSPSARHPNIRKGEVIEVDDVKIRVMNEPYLFQTNAINNSSVAFRVEMNGKRILFLGDMGVPAGNSFLNEYRGEMGELKADIVEMAHHGEQGVDEKVYQAIQPNICLWCCPGWLWDNDNGGGQNSGPWKTLEVRGWMRSLGVKTHVIEKDGDQVLR